MCVKKKQWWTKEKKKERCAQSAANMAHQSPSRDTVSAAVPFPSIVLTRPRAHARPVPWSRLKATRRRSRKKHTQKTATHLLQNTNTGAGGLQVNKPGTGVWCTAGQVVYLSSTNFENSLKIKWHFFFSAGSNKALVLPGCRRVRRMMCVLSREKLGWGAGRGWTAQTAWVVEGNRELVVGYLSWISPSSQYSTQLTLWSRSDVLFLFLI